MIKQSRRTRFPMALRRKGTPLRVKIRGFTLIELLVTISIVAVLATLLFPMVQKSLEKSGDAQRTSNLRQIGIALLAFANENDARFPLAAGVLPYMQDPTAEANISWQQALDPYVSSNRKIFLFPNSPLSNSTVQPSDSVAGFFLGSRAAYVDYLDNSLSTIEPLNLLRIQNPSAYILAGEVVFNSFPPEDADRDNYSTDPALNGRDEIGKPAKFLFADGSVRQYARFDQTSITTRYNGPGLSDPEW